MRAIANINAPLLANIAKWVVQHFKLRGKAMENSLSGFLVELLIINFEMEMKAFSGRCYHEYDIAMMCLQFALVQKCPRKTTYYPLSTSW